MPSKSMLCAATLLAVSTSLFAVGRGVDFGSSSKFAVDRKTQIPGDTLKPGSYSIQVVAEITDRMIVRVDSATNKDHALFLAVPSRGIGGTTPGTVTWAASPNGTPALRGFTFSTGETVEFVYPKAEAAALAKLNAAPVVAIDPESEGRAKLKSLSEDDMKVVSLWVLSLTTAGPDSKTPALLAQHYQDTRGASQPAVATTSQPTDAAPPATQVAKLEQPRGQNEAPSAAPAPAKRRHVVSVLPHTASTLPIIFLLGIISLVMALGVRIGRIAVSSISTGK